MTVVYDGEKIAATYAVACIGKVTPLLLLAADGVFSRSARSKYPEVSF